MVKPKLCWRTIRRAGRVAAGAMLTDDQVSAVVNAVEAMLAQYHEQAHLRAETPALCSTCNGTRTVHFGGRFVLCQDCDPPFAATIAAVADALPVEPQIGGDVREKVRPMRADEPAPDRHFCAEKYCRALIPMHAAFCGEHELARREYGRTVRRTVEQARAEKAEAELDKARGAFEAMREMYRDATAGTKRAEAALETTRAECEAMRAVCEAAQGFYDDYERYELLKKSPSNVTLWDAVDALRAAQGKGQE